MNNKIEVESFVDKAGQIVKRGDYLENGTPKRKNGTRVINKAGKVLSVIGYFKDK